MFPKGSHLEKQIKSHYSAAKVLPIQKMKQQSLGILAHLLRMRLEPKYYAFLEVIGHPNRSWCRGNADDSRPNIANLGLFGFCQLNRLTVATVVQQRKDGWIGSKENEKNMRSMAGFLKNKTHVTCSITENYQKKHMPGDWTSPFWNGSVTF